MDNGIVVTGKIPTSISFVDELLGGGIKVGRTYGLTGFSGGGKTTLANQIAVAHAMSGDRMLVCNVTEVPDANFLAPVYANACGIKRSVVENVRCFGDLQAADQAKYRVVQSQLASRLDFLDGTSAKDGALSIERALLRNTGSPYRGIVLDSFEIFAIRSFNAARFESEEDVSVSGYSHRLLNELKQLAHRRNIWIWITAHVGSESFPWMCDSCLTMSKLDMHQRCEVSVGRGRGHKTNRARVRLDGEFGRFVALP